MVLIIAIVIALPILGDQRGGKSGPASSCKSFQERLSEPLGCYSRLEPVPRLLQMLVSYSFFVLCPIGAQHLSRLFRDLLIRRSLPANSTIRRFRLHGYCAGELCWIRVFSETEAHKTEEMPL